MKPILWNGKSRELLIVDQSLLPAEVRIIACRSVDDIIESIRRMRVRGAPALEVVGAFGVAISALSSNTADDVRRDAARILGTRPTAVNLRRGVERALSALSSEGWREKCLQEALSLMEEDARRNKLIGRHGSKLISDGDTVLTYCNAGRMACADYGTALGIVRAAVEEGKRVKVVACETRPVNQGSRITSLELMEDGIDVTVITDNAAPYLMQRGEINKVVVGADRITRDAVINKVGTYMISLAAREHSIPFYVAAPTSTIDLETRTGDVPIEERGDEEIRFIGGILNVPYGVKVRNPAFDITPLSNVTAIVTERGIAYPPYEESLGGLCD